MKKITLIIGLGILLTGCEKNPKSFNENCECGLITEVQYASGYYFVDIKNNCSDNSTNYMIEWDKLPVPEAGRSKCLGYEW